MAIQIKTDNRKAVLQALQRQSFNALEICGGKAETYAKRNCPIDMGTLRNSISHKVDESELKAYIGTNTEYVGRGYCERFWSDRAEERAAEKVVAKEAAKEGIREEKRPSLKMRLEEKQAQVKVNEKTREVPTKTKDKDVSLG